MPEEEMKIFGEAYRIYEKWRGTEISTPDQWMQVTNDFWTFARAHLDNPLAMNLAIGIMDTFDDLYRNGQKPAVPDYLGRSDL